MEWVNATIAKFGYPATLIKEYEHWVLLVRPTQVTAGSLILAAKSHATAFGDLDAGAHAELHVVTKQVETMLSAEVRYDKINYLMLMMIDPHVHFHIFPRYEGSRSIVGLELNDAGWPGPPDLKAAMQLSPAQIVQVTTMLSGAIDRA